jgi:hypothetical protein
MRMKDCMSSVLGALVVASALLMLCYNVVADSCGGCSANTSPCSSSRWTIPPGGGTAACYYTGRLQGQCKSDETCVNCACKPINDPPDEDSQCECKKKT